MIGNDIIDISQSRIESNWKRKGFIEKIFSPDEQIIIANDSNPEIMVWLLWSMKEAAYKIYNRQTKIREYIPKKLTCTILSKGENGVLGQVECMNSIYHTKTDLAKTHIHTIAVSSLSDLCNVVEIENKNIFKDHYGIPSLKIKPNQFQEVSISNHGKFEKVVVLKSN